MTTKTVFIVSKDPAVRDSLSKLVAAAALRAETLPCVEAWLAASEPEPRGCLVLEASVDDALEPDRLARFASVCATLPVLVLVNRGDIPTAVRAIKHGAADVVQKPFRDENLLERIKQAIAEKGNADG